MGSISFELPHKQPAALCHTPEKTVQLKSAKLESTDCVTVDDSPLSNSSPLTCVLTKGPELTSKPMLADLQAKCHLSYPTLGSCDHNGGVLSY